jgi:small subunit ribosomal protein S6
MMDVDAPPAALAELERQTGLNEDVLRFMTIKVDAHEAGPSVMMRKNDRDRERGERGGRDDRGPRGGFGGDRGDRGDRGGFGGNDRGGDRDRAPRAEQEA